jgi:hypothetical protein
MSCFMNSSRADSRVNCLKTSDVSETRSASILWQRDHLVISQSPSSGKEISKWSLSLRMETERVSETSEVFKQLTRLSAREEFIQFCRRESLKTYKWHAINNCCWRQAWDNAACVVYTCLLSFTLPSSIGLSRIYSTSSCRQLLELPLLFDFTC